MDDVPYCTTPAPITTTSGSTTTTTTTLAKTFLPPSPIAPLPVLPPFDERYLPTLGPFPTAPPATSTAAVPDSESFAQLRDEAWERERLAGCTALESEYAAMVQGCEGQRARASLRRGRIVPTECQCFCAPCDYGMPTLPPCKPRPTTTEEALTSTTAVAAEEVDTVPKELPRFPEDLGYWVPTLAPVDP